MRFQGICLLNTFFVKEIIHKADIYTRRHQVLVLDFNRSHLNRPVFRSIRDVKKVNTLELFNQFLSYRQNFTHKDPPI
jgi:hypothetical protein